MAIARIGSSFAGIAVAGGVNPTVVSIGAVPVNSRIIVFTDVASTITDSKGNSYTSRTLDAYANFADGLVKTALLASDTLSISRIGGTSSPFYVVSVWTGIDTANPFYSYTNDDIDGSPGYVYDVFATTGTVPREGSLVMRYFYVENRGAGSAPQITFPAFTVASDPATTFVNGTGAVTPPGGSGSWWGVDWEYRLLSRSESNMDLDTYFATGIDFGFWASATYQPPQIFRSMA